MINWLAQGFITIMKLTIVSFDSSFSRASRGSRHR